MNMTGERVSVPEGLPTLPESYEPRDIYKVDETGLFYRALPDSILSIKGQDVAGGKVKERITECLCANMLEANYEDTGDRESGEATLHPQHQPVQTACDLGKQQQGLDDHDDIRRMAESI